MAQFETFRDPQLEKMFAEAQRFAASVNYTPPYWLTLAGKTGTGKTYLAKKIWKQFIDQNRFEVHLDRSNQRIYGNGYAWINWRVFCKNVRDGGYGLIQDAINEWFVVLDDIGAVRDPTGFVTDLLDQIIAGRSEKWTLITSNLSLKEIANSMDVRIADRMLRDGGVVVQVNTLSYTQRNQNIKGAL